MHAPGGSLGRRSVASGRQGPGEGASTGPLGGPPGGRALRARRGREDEGGLAFSRLLRGEAFGVGRSLRPGSKECATAYLPRLCSTVVPVGQKRRKLPRESQDVEEARADLKACLRQTALSKAPLRTRSAPFRPSSARFLGAADSWRADTRRISRWAVLWHSLARRSLLRHVLARRVRCGAPLADTRTEERQIPQKGLVFANPALGKPSIYGCPIGTAIASGASPCPLRTCAARPAARSKNPEIRGGLTRAPGGPKPICVFVCLIRMHIYIYI